MSPTKKKTSGKMTQCVVNMLDDSKLELAVEKKSTGSDILQRIADEINLLEYEYFGLLFYDTAGHKVWVSPEKKVSSQIKNAWVVYFRVKFYPPEPSQLSEDITRYQLCLQVRRDIVDNKLPCSFVTHALLGSYLVQSEVGDFDTREHTSPAYLDAFAFAPSPAPPELPEKVMELHRTHRGQTPAEAELLYLENAKKLAMYGVSLHEARDQDSVDILLGVCASGLLVYRDRLRINRFAWPKILKLSYKRHFFYVKIRPAEYERVESTIGFRLAHHKGAKRLWKTCVEHHTFFRLTEPVGGRSGRGLLPTLGSRFRYSGRTQHQSRRRAQQSQRRGQDFSRSLSRRLSSRSCDELGEEGASPGHKRHTMSHPPPHIPGLDPPTPQASSPVPGAKKNRRRGSASSGTSGSSLEGVFHSGKPQHKKPIGGVSVLPSPHSHTSPTSPSYATSSPKHAKNGVSSRRGSQQDSSKGAPGVHSSKPYGEGRHSPKSPGGTGLSSAKSPGGRASTNKAPGSPDSPPYTRQYSYEELDKEPRRTYSPTSHGFSYEGGKQDGSQEASGGQVRRGHAQAFNYAPEGLDLKAKEKELGSEASSPGPVYRKQDIDAGLMPESAVGEGSSSALDTSTEVSAAVAAGKGTPKKDKKADKDKSGKSDKKGKKSADKAAKRTSGAKEEAKAKNMRKKFGIFGGLLGKPKQQKQKPDEQGSHSGSNESISSKDSSSDDSVIQEARETAQPQDLDASLAASDRLPRDQSTLLQADVSNRSYSVADQTLNASDITPADNTLTEEPETGLTGLATPPAALGMTRTTTHTSSHTRRGEATEQRVHAVEGADGSLTVSTTQQKKSVEERAHVQATTVTTITEQHTTQPDHTATKQVQEKTFSATTRTEPTGQQEETVKTHHTTTQSTQRHTDPAPMAEVRRLPLPGPPSRDRTLSSGSDDSGTSVDPLDGPPSALPDPPLTRVGVLPPQDDSEAEIVSSQAVSSKTRTVETITYHTEHGGLTETRVQKKITIESDGGAPIDHDAALARAIQEATACNPDMTVERIEIEQQTTQ